MSREEIIEAVMSITWYYQLLGESFGPVSLELLRELKDLGQLAPDDPVRDGETGDWRPSREIPQLYPELHPQPAEPGEIVLQEIFASPAGPVELQYYLLVFGLESGPFTRRELRMKVHSGELLPEDKIRLSESEEWVTATSVLGQFTAKPAAPVLKETARAGSSVPDLGSRVTAAAVVDSRPEAPPPKAAPTATPAPAAKPVGDEWYCFTNGDTYGPITRNVLGSWVTEGRLLHQDKVKHGKEGDWVEVSELPEAKTPVVQEAPKTASPSRSGTIPSVPSAATPTAVGPSVVPEPEPVPVPTPAPIPSAAPATSYTPPPTVSSSGGMSSFSTPASKPAPPPPAPNKASGKNPLGEMLKDLKLDPKLLAAIGGVVVALVIMFMGLGWLNFGGTSDKVVYSTFQKSWEEFKELRARGASETEWNEFKDRSEKLITPIVHEMEATTSSVRPNKVTFLTLGRDLWPNLLQNSRTINPDGTQTDDEQKFEQNLTLLRDQIHAN